MPGPAGGTFRNHRPGRERRRARRVPRLLPALHRRRGRDIPRHRGRHRAVPPVRRDDVGERPLRLLRQPGRVERPRRPRLHRDRDARHVAGRRLPRLARPPGRAQRRHPRSGPQAGPGPAAPHAASRPSRLRLRPDRERVGKVTDGPADSFRDHYRTCSSLRQRLRSRTARRTSLGRLLRMSASTRPQWTAGCRESARLDRSSRRTPGSGVRREPPLGDDAAAPALPSGRRSLRCRAL